MQVDDILVTWYLAISHCKRLLLSSHRTGNLIASLWTRLHWFRI